MQKLINLTPHAINIVCVSGAMEIAPSGTICRVATTQQPLVLKSGEDFLLPFSVVETTFGEVENLPEPEPDTWYIVSGMVRTALGQSRPDVIAPDTGASALREAGVIRAVTRMIGVAEAGRIYQVYLEGYGETEDSERLIKVFVRQGDLWKLEALPQVKKALIIPGSPDYDFHLHHDYASLKAYVEDVCST